MVDEKVKSNSMRYLLALVVTVAVTPSALPQSEVKPIPVLTTWEALRQRPAIDLGD